MKFKIERLKHLSSASLNKIFSKIDANTNELILKGDQLNIDDPSTTFKSIPNNISILSLSGNFLYNTKIQVTKTLVASVPQNIEVLRITNNKMWSKNSNQLVTIFSSIALNIINLDLSHNSLNSKNIDSLKKCFAAIPATVINIDLSHTNLNQFSLKNLDKLKNSLPFVQSVILSGNEFKEMDLEQRKRLSAIFPNAKTFFIALKNQGDRMPLVFYKNLISFVKQESNVIDLDLTDLHSVTLSFSELEKMDLEQRKILKTIFKNITVLDNQHNKMSPLFHANLYKSLGLESEVPSLFQQASFFVGKHKKDKELRNYKSILPKEVIESVHSSLSQ